MRTPPLSPADASLNLPLPRPPAWIWLFTTQTGPGRVFAATSESAARSTGAPFEIGTPNSCSSALAWYSWMFIFDAPDPRAVSLEFTPALRAGIPYTRGSANSETGVPKADLLDLSADFDAISGRADPARSSCRHRPDPAPPRPTCRM